MNPTPTMAGHIDHRILLNYRVDPDVAAAAVDRPARPPDVRETGPGRLPHRPAAGASLVRASGRPSCG